MARQKNRLSFILSFICITSLLLFSTASNREESGGGSLPPIDPQQVQDQDLMTWDDYHPIPGKNWADPSLKPERGFRLAVVAIDFPDQPFVITLPKGSDPFGNPQIDPIPRENVPQFYAEFFMAPSEVNHGQTINGYWMEQSRGKFGITEVDVYGPYRMPKPIWAYGLNEYGQNDQTPDGSRANSRMEREEWYVTISTTEWKREIPDGFDVAADRDLCISIVGIHACQMPRIGNAFYRGAAGTVSYRRCRPRRLAVA